MSRENIHFRLVQRDYGFALIDQDDREVSGVTLITVEQRGGVAEIILHLVVLPMPERAATA